MNPITFNRNLPTKLLAAIEGKVLAMPQKVLKGPIFISDDDINKKEKRKHSLDRFFEQVEYGNLLPFQDMRLYIPRRTENFLKQNGMKYWLSYNAVNGLRIIGMADHDFGKRLIFGLIVRDRKWNGFLYDQTRELIIGLKELPEDFKVDLFEFLGQVAWVILEINSPTNFIAKVEPNKNGKSVEWRESRSHYVIIDRGHPANSKSIEHGSTVIDSTDARQTRMAHSRRAHTRVLRSERFRRARGRKVWVKACWVGPKEWKDAGSIYRIEHDFADRMTG